MWEVPCKIVSNKYQTIKSPDAGTLTHKTLGQEHILWKVGHRLLRKIHNF